ncbi:MAG: ABC-2 type transport system ATP-binding protein [Myxococcota bacterium]|jgi:ABC-2 type transport system ATP-binding protein
MTELAIEIRALRKVYRTGFWMRPFVGLSGLDLDVGRGEIFGFVGPNGAGKTTTMKILTGLQTETSGTARILGIPHTDPASRRKLGFLPERPYFYVHLTARELLHFYGQLFGLSKSERSTRADHLLERVGLVRVADTPLREYSKGMLQRVGLCQTLLHDPDLIILDEPMSGLDPVGRALVRDLILEERAAGRTVFFSSHILSDVESLCDRVGVIISGELRSLGTVSSLIGDRVKHIDCIFSDLPDDTTLPGEVLPSSPGLLRLRTPPESLDATLAAVLSAGGRVVQVLPIRQTLEEVLVDEIQHPSASGGKP